jgi:hypothetical protein
MQKVMQKALFLFLLVFPGLNTALEAQIPSHRDYRPLTFSRPSAAIRNFYYPRTHSLPTSYYGVGRSYVRSAYSPSYFSSTLSPDAAGRSSYYKSVTRGYGPGPFTGMDASRHLYGDRRPIINWDGDASILPYSPFEDTYRGGYDRTHYGD